VISRECINPAHYIIPYIIKGEISNAFGAHACLSTAWMHAYGESVFF